MEGEEKRGARMGGKLPELVSEEISSWPQLHIS